ncbi:MAG: hypothetical protein IBX69_17855 [Anaerolineales bacterium]|nr:hypothetical protein [Anaerolineales bacterium]
MDEQRAGAEVIEQITQMFTNKHSLLEAQWNQGNDVSQLKIFARLPWCATTPSSTVWWFESRRKFYKDL